MALRTDNRPPPLFRAGSDRILPGLRRTVLVPAPGAGNQWTATVPGGRKWRILMGVSTFTASVTAANRQVGVQITDGVEPLIQYAASALVTASQTTICNYATGNGFINAGGQANGFLLPTGGIWLGSQFVVGSYTTSMQAGDTYSQTALFIEELYESDQDLRLAREHWEREVEHELEAGAAGTTGG